MRFVWFWSFWYWGIEGHRDGSLLRGPVHGIAGHWDEWFRHEASEEDCRAIEAVGGSAWTQREFVRWLMRCWGREARWRDTRPPVRFILAQLASQAPFDQWTALETYRSTYGAKGISALVLTEGSAGEASDVRPVEAVLLPADIDRATPPVLADGFQVERSELAAARQAALDLLGGRGLSLLLVLWILRGRRPYPLWLRGVLTVGWAAVGGGTAFLLLGPEPGGRLVPIAAGIVILWTGLVLTALIAISFLSLEAWRQGREWSNLLRSAQVRLHMNGGLTLVGGSAGLPFCLNILLSVARAHPRSPPRSWIWRRLVAGLRSGAGSWAATGVLAPDGRISPVVLGPKLRACQRHGGIRQVLTPRQPDVDGISTSRAAEMPGPLRRMLGLGGALTRPPLGFAAERPSLRCRPSRHVAGAALAIGGLEGRGRLGVALVSCCLSAVMIAALPDLRALLLPPPPPAVVGPASASPYYLWVGLETRNPEAFQVVLESGFWANRRVDAVAHDGSVRAEIRLRRLSHNTVPDSEDGTLWVERRRRFLFREFDPGERVGHYTFSYVTHGSDE